MPTPPSSQLDPSDRVRIAGLLSDMTVNEKVAQLVGLWVMLDTTTGDVAPYQGTFVASRTEEPPVAEQIAHGLGQLTRFFGSAPITATEGARLLSDLQRRLVEDTRPGIPAIVHEECLTGLMALGATAFPCPLNWGSTWDPALIERMGDAIRAQMRSVGAHQGLAPVLDVVRDPRWGRVEECIAEDPYLVGMIGSAYVRGLQGSLAGGLSNGVVATGKHFAGYSFSEGGRNLAPAHLGPRELADVFLVPFEMAIREGLESVMNAYQEVDGVPVAASRELLSTVLRDQLGFDGLVVSDYFSIAFLHALHGAASSNMEAAAMALVAGIDVELPSPDCYGQPLLDALDRGLVSEAAIDRSVERVLAVKARLGLLDQAFTGPKGDIDLDPPTHRALAREVAEKSIVLLHNDQGLLPLRRPKVVAVVGPNADSPYAVLGNYTFTNHVAAHFSDAPGGVAVTTVLDGLRAGCDRQTRVVHAAGCDVLGDRTDGFADAVDLAAHADVAVVVVGDQAGHFGAGTSGEGTDTDDLRLPGVQELLIDAVVATGTPTVVVLVSGRPYAIGRLSDQAAALVAAWFPGEEAGTAIANVLFGHVNPSGRTPVTFSRGAGQQPQYYNAKPLGRTGYARSSSRPVFAFGHGLSYTSFSYSDLVISPATVPIDGVADISCTVTNDGGRTGDEVVQLYLHDVFATVIQPAQTLKAFCRLSLEPGQSAVVTFHVDMDVLSFTGRELTRIVEPGRIDVAIGASSTDLRLQSTFEIVGAGPRRVGEKRVLTVPTHVVIAIE